MLDTKLKYFILSETDYLAQTTYYSKIYNFLINLNFEYPNFKKWYQSLFYEVGFLKENREIIICSINDNIAGVAILKSDISENKICTLRVASEYQNIGIGRALLEMSFEYLNNEKPLITIHISKYHNFKKLFERYNFKLEQQIQSYYGLFRSELSYNGVLLNENRNISIANKIAYSIEKKLSTSVCKNCTYQNKGKDEAK